MARLLRQQGTVTTQTLDSPVLTTPALGTPSAGVITNLTGIKSILRIKGNFYPQTSTIIEHKKHTDFDYSSLGLEKELLAKLSFDEKQKIVMTRTAALPVQSR